MYLTFVNLNLILSQGLVFPTQLDRVNPDDKTLAKQSFGLDSLCLYEKEVRAAGQKLQHFLIKE